MFYEDSGDESEILFCGKCYRLLGDLARHQKMGWGARKIAVASFENDGNGDVTGRGGIFSSRLVLRRLDILVAGYSASLC